jgi:hypothetical protein
LLVLPKLESLKLEIEPEVYGLEHFSFDNGFYNAMNKLAANGKLKTLRIKTDIMAENDIAELKKRFPQLNISVTP